MHVEICVEDASGKILLDGILPRIIRADVTWRVHGYRGIGRIPKGLHSTDNAEHRIILENLPKLIRGCANTPYVSVLIILIDTDSRDCKEFLQELKSVSEQIAPQANVVFRLTIEEIEAWLLGDPDAIEAAYPNAQIALLNSYVQDSVCGTWEKLADVVHPGGAAQLNAVGWPAPGVAKCTWATDIPPHMDFTRNRSPSFRKFIEALVPYT